MARCYRSNDWEKKRQQAQPYINKIRSGLEKKTRWYEQIGFLTKCQKEGLVPRGLRVRLPVSVMNSGYGERLKRRSEKRVIKRTISNLFVKIQKVNKDVAEKKLILRQDLGFIQKTVNWVGASLKKSAAKVRNGLQQKLRSLQAQKVEEVKNTKLKQKSVKKKKVVYNNSSRFLTEEQMNLLALSLNFGSALKKFPLVEYVAATEDPCQR